MAVYLARQRQYRERKNIALDQREKACRDLRQTVSIAYNDTLRLSDQLSRIRTQVSLVERTRAAYRDQFNIGQRTLLDLLNTQNEYFDARRALVNAEADLSIAHLRTQAGSGRLLENLGLKRLELVDGPEDDDLTPVDPAQLCPPMTPAETTLDRAALERQVQALREDNPALLLIGGRQATAVEPTPTAAPGDRIETDIVVRTTASGQARIARRARLSWFLCRRVCPRRWDESRELGSPARATHCACRQHPYRNPESGRHRDRCNVGRGKFPTSLFNGGRQRHERENARMASWKLRHQRHPKTSLAPGLYGLHVGENG